MDPIHEKVNCVLRIPLLKRQLRACIILRAVSVSTDHEREQLNTVLDSVIEDSKKKGR